MKSIEQLSKSVFNLISETFSRDDWESIEDVKTNNGDWVLFKNTKLKSENGIVYIGWKYATEEHCMVLLPTQTLPSQFFGNQYSGTMPHINLRDMDNSMIRDMFNILYCKDEYGLITSFYYDITK